MRIVLLVAGVSIVCYGLSVRLSAPDERSAPPPTEAVPARDGGAEGQAAVALDGSLLRTGDLLFRKGRSRDSEIVMLLDSQSPFSHVGLVLREEEEVAVIHVVPGSSAQGRDVVRREPLDDFLGPASAAAVLRVGAESEHHAARAAAAAESYRARRVRFDDAFDAGSADRLYCTELVWRAYQEGGLDLLDGRLASLPFPLARGRYVLLSALLESRHLREVFSSTAR